MWSSGSLLVLIFGLFGPILANEDFSGYKLFQTKPSNDRHRELLGQMDEFYPEDVVDFWTDIRSETVEFLVQVNITDDLIDLLEQENVTYRVKIDDFQRVVDDEMRNIEYAEEEFNFKGGDGPADFRSEFNLFNYHKLEKIETYITQLEGAYPDVVTVTNLQSTYEGRQIKLVSVSLDPSQKSNRPAIFMDCGIHAREWVSPAFCIYTLDRLVEEGSSGLLNDFDIYLIPVANPDGYAYTWTGSRGRMWRKNRRPASMLLTKNVQTYQFWPNQGGFGGSNGFPVGNMPTWQGGSTSKCWGTDPNRNFDIGHGTVGASNNPCQDTFHGERAFSDAESQALRDSLQRVLAEHNQKVAYVSVHAFSQLWMYPNGYTKSHSKHHNDLKLVASKAVQALRNAHGTVFKYGPIATIIYEASGSSVDWAHEKLGIKYSYALELRDKGQHGFMLPVNEIQPTVEETWSGIVGMANEIKKEFGGGGFQNTQNSGLVDVYYEDEIETTTSIESDSNLDLPRQ